MQTLFVSILTIVFLASCNKKGTTRCEEDMRTIAGKYKLTKLEQVSYNTGAAQDVTSTLPGCELSGIYNFNADSTASYTEPVSCSDSGSGTWNLLQGHFYTLFTSGSGGRISATSVVSWDCTNLVLITEYPSVVYNLRFTLTKFH